MIRLEMENYNTILIEKLSTYLPHHQSILISMTILLVKKYYYLIKKKIIEQSNFRYSPLGKAFEKQIKTFEDQGKKQVGALKDLKDNKEK